MFLQCSLKMLGSAQSSLIIQSLSIRAIPTVNYIFKVNNRNTIRRCETCSKLTIKTQERRHWCRSGVVIVNFEHISHLAQVVLVLTRSR